MNIVEVLNNNPKLFLKTLSLGQLEILKVMTEEAVLAYKEIFISPSDETDEKKNNLKYWETLKDYVNEEINIREEY